MDATIDGTRHFHDGQDGWIMNKTQWVISGPGMNGIHPWPPVSSIVGYSIGYRI
jgi:hypothetical protein